MLFNEMMQQTNDRLFKKLLFIIYVTVQLP